MPGPFNMALDEALFESVATGRSRPLLRLYRWNRPTITLGYAQKGSRAVNQQVCAELGYDIVRRLTGGRAVLHDREVTYSVISSERSPLFNGKILDNYKVIAEVLRHAFDSFGLHVEIAPGRSRGGGGEEAYPVCFMAPSSYELVFKGCKMAGSAQKRGEGAFLQHGSIPFEMDLAGLFRALDTRGAISSEEGVRTLKEKVGWLNRFLDRPVSPEEMEEQLVTSFQKVCGVRFDEEAPTPEEICRAEELCAIRYGDTGWTFNGCITG